MARAAQTLFNFSAETVPTKEVSSRRGTVKRLQRLTHEVCLSPSSTPNSTSVGDPRRVDVTAATVTVWSDWISEGRLSTRTGRRLSGLGRSRSQISPLPILLATPVRRSNPRSRPASHQPDLRRPARSLGQWRVVSLLPDTTPRRNARRRTGLAFGLQDPGQSGGVVPYRSRFVPPSRA